MKVAVATIDEFRMEKLLRALRRGHVVVDVASDAPTLLDFLANYQYDAVIVSDAIDGRGGRRLVKDLRSQQKRLPILVFGPTEAQVRIDCFASGADDVISSETDGEEALARLRSVIRRSCGWSEASISVDNVVMNTESQSVAVADVLLYLTAKEYQIFELFLLKPNMVITKHNLLDRLYSGLEEPDDRIIGVFLCTLRRKLREAGAAIDIATMRGVGYMLVPARSKSNGLRTAASEIARLSRPQPADAFICQ